MKVIFVFLKFCHLFANDLNINLNSYQILFHHAYEHPIILKYACECPIIPRIMLAKTVTCEFQNYAGTLGSGLSKA